MHIFTIWLSFSTFLSGVISLTCGIDRSSVQHVYEGVSRIETYPWLGVLYYPHNGKKFTTAVVLVTRQIVLAAATEIDSLPKDDFRDRARVIIGHNCTGQRGIGVRDYTYHPDYTKSTYSTLALIQLETDQVKIELRPICPPPPHFKNQNFFAMVLSENCKRSRVRLHKMTYVSPQQCKSFYRRTGLDVETIWPSHTACARSVRGGHCVWRSGAILVVKVGTRWRLLGFGVYGPGCQAPARFLDYGMYHEWVQRRIARIGRPAITTLADNVVVLRRTMSNVQRFGPCDRGETIHELYSDTTNIYSTGNRNHMMRYNVTIVGDVEYSCVVFRADSQSRGTDPVPKLRLRRWCAGQKGMCHVGFQFIEIHFYVEITFQSDVQYHVIAYGRDAKAINPIRAINYVNNYAKFPTILNSTQTKQIFVEAGKTLLYAAG